MTNNSRQTEPISENAAVTDPGTAAAIADVADTDTSMDGAGAVTSGTSAEDMSAVFPDASTAAASEVSYGIHETVEVAPSPAPEPERLLTAVYIRESNEAVRGVMEQKLCDYVDEQPDLAFVSCYVEDCEDVKLQQTLGSQEAEDTETGAADSLPEFLRLMSDVRSGEFQCIVVRDLDSFARDFIETAYYIQQVFRYLGVRLIAVEDQFDSDREEDLESLTAQADKAVSDRRSDELSRKRCAVAEKRAKEPDAMPSGSPPYGYLLSTEGGVRKYVPDPEIAPYVRIMFKWAVLGTSSRQIAERMQILGVPTPGQLRLGQTVDPSKWEAHAVLKILENPNYTGDICLQRMKQARYKSQSRRRTSADEWIVRKNTHEPLVTREDFAAVQERLAQNCKRARNAKTS